ncbi:4-(cytidine 5'-diphospho)-2-C-methyl-D-erythritol kinase [Oceanobacillus halotolerans]|uniref:4-(cytidine 5'-diphospho)-2-C-methyl-D-erythritol kinase n=1 Tax=Oceanobacillus halotolerans TaxID=2663380 RepID=UPI0013D1760D|nr:4-(cytidine 5'-diphospho)-2-C-methyl-D-erythritol kinase [Oceanobacillus halotolerans]
MVLLEKALAKITLSLDVLHKREDGFHEVEMIMTTVDLADRIELYPLKQKRIEVTADNQYVPNDERNLAYKAADLLKRTYQIDTGVGINIQKHIPVSAGLGGGSSDAAAVLRALNRLWALDLNKEELAALGASIGSDVPFCVYSTTALAKGRGEKLSMLPAPPPCWVILAKPNIGVSTRTIFPQLNLANIVHPNTRDVVKAIKKKDFPSLSRQVGNVLETVTLNQYPEAKRIKEKMIQYGASGVSMSGSGPTIFGLVEHRSKAHRIYNGLRGFCHEVKLVRLLGHE